MTDPHAIFPNETYLEGLRNADPAVVEALYNEFRQPVSKAVQSAGGSYADGNTFFRVALIQSAGLVNQGNYLAGVPISIFLEKLALAQYRDWLAEKGQIIPENVTVTEEELPEMPQFDLPEVSELRQMRLQIRAKRQFARLSPHDQRQIATLATALANDNLQAESPLPQNSIDQYKTLLNAREMTWEKPLPNWAVAALTDAHFQKIWSHCEALEGRLAAGLPISGKAPNANKAVLYAFLGFILLTLGFAVYTWTARDRSPAKVYDNNFQPPSSILEDMAARYANDSIAPARPEICTIAFSEADAYYKKKEWREAAGVLANMMEDTLASCQSDALFYLAILGLQLEKPELTLDCIAKIDDLDRFGEDIYWYMALAYVKIAAQDPSEKNTARRAVERAFSNTEIPARRAQAEKMLEELGD